MELNDLDYKRLNMTTKMIKVVTKIQEQQRVTEETEEWIEEETPAQPSQIDHPRNINEPQIHVADPENLYAGINLEEVGNYIDNVDIVIYVYIVCITDYRRQPNI